MSQTHKQRVLELLRDGKPHTHHELYALGCVAHSRVSDLRRDGYRIEQWRDGDSYLYRLLNAPTDASGRADAPVGALSQPSASSPAGSSKTAASREGDPVGGQLALSIPRSAYEVAA